MLKNQKELQELIDKIDTKTSESNTNSDEDISDAEIINDDVDAGILGMLGGLGIPSMFGGPNPSNSSDVSSGVKYGTHFTLIRSVFEKFDKEFSSIIEDIVMYAGKEFNEILFNCTSIEELQVIATREMMNNSTSIDNKVSNTAIRMYSGYKLLDRFFKGNKEKMADFIEVYRRDVKEETKNKWNMVTDGAVGDAITMLCKEIEETAISVLFLYEKWIGLELNKEVNKDGE